MADLQNAQIDQSYPSLIKTFDNGPISTSGFPLITDGAGTNTMIGMSATELQLGTNINTQYFKQYANSGGSTELKDVLIRMDDATASQYFQLDATNAGMGAGANYFLASAAGNSIVGPLDLSGATVTGLPGGASGLENGTGTSSLQSAASLTTTAANAGGNNAIALGNNARVPGGSDNIAIGNGAQVNSSANNSQAFGENASANSSDATAIGNGTDAGQGGTALGTFAQASGLYSTAVGKNSNTSATESTAIGRSATANASGATAIGRYVTASIVDTVSVKALETQTDKGISIKGDGTNAGKLKLYCEDAAGAHNVTLEGPAHAGGATYALKFPNVQSAGTQILEADASGNLAWINTPSGGGGGGAASDEGQAITPAIATNSYSIPWILSGYNVTNGKSFLQANSIQFIPFYAKAGEAISDFYFRVQTAAAGATMNVGLYKAYTSTVNGFKQTMPEYVADIATGVDVSTTGKKSFTGLNISLPADAVGACYWLAFQSDTIGVRLTKWSNWVAAERQIYNDIYRGTGVEKTSTAGLPTGQVSLTGSGLGPSTDLALDFAWRYKS